MNGRQIPRVTTATGHILPVDHEVKIRSRVRGQRIPPKKDDLKEHIILLLRPVGPAEDRFTLPKHPAPGVRDKKYELSGREDQVCLKRRRIFDDRNAPLQRNNELIGKLDEF